MHFHRTPFLFPRSEITMRIRTSMQQQHHVFARFLRSHRKRSLLIAFMHIGLQGRKRECSTRWQGINDTADLFAFSRAQIASERVKKRRELFAGLSTSAHTTTHQCCCENEQHKIDLVFIRSKTFSSFRAINSAEKLRSNK